MSKNKAPAFQFYPGDYLSDANTVVFTAEQDGHYLRLLCFCWIEGSIPSDPDQIQNLLKGSSRVDEVTLQPVLNCFKLDEKSGRLVHQRLLKEKKKQGEWRKKCSKGGKASGQTRRGPNGSSDDSKGSSRVVKQGLNTSTSSSSSISTSVKKTPKKKVVKKPKESAETTTALKAWVAAYEKEFQEYPEVDPKRDNSILKKLIDKHGAEKVLEKIELHIKLGDYLSIPGLKAVWNSLGVAKKNTTRGAKKQAAAKEIMQKIEEGSGNVFDIIPEKRRMNA